MKDLDKIFLFLEKEFSNSLINKSSIKFFNAINHFPDSFFEIDIFDDYLKNSTFLKFSPLVVVASIFLFFSFSDHPLSIIGTLTFILGTTSFYIGTLIKIPKIRKLNKKYFTPLVGIFSFLFLLSLIKIESFGFYVKLSLIPLILIGLNERRSKDFCFSFNDKYR